MPIILLGLVAGNLAVGFALGRFVHSMLFERAAPIYIPQGPFPSMEAESPQPEVVVSPEKPSKSTDDGGFVKF